MSRKKKDDTAMIGWFRSMKTNVKIASLLLRGILSSVVIVSLFIIIQRYWLWWIPHLMSVSFIVAILSTSLLIKTDRLKNAIWTGIGIGILTGILFFSYFSIDAYLRIGLEEPEATWGFLFMFSGIFTMMWMISCTIGTVASYFVRQRDSNMDNIHEK